MLFEWDEGKRTTNFAKHHIDFEGAKRIFDGPTFERMESRHGEERLFAIGLMEGIEIVVVYVTHGSGRRIISARRANRDEGEKYVDHLRNAERGQD
jgi:uncharacterized DUF497 family protein